MFPLFFDTQAGSYLMSQQFKLELVNVQILCTAKAEPDTHHSLPYEWF